jgi:hypothetical protein
MPREGSHGEHPAELTTLEEAVAGLAHDGDAVVLHA